MKKDFIDRSITDNLKELVMFSRFKSTPKIVEAVQFTDENKNQVFNFLSGNVYADFENGKPILRVTTMHGDSAIIRFGDWIVKDALPGTYYPLKDEVKEELYSKL